MGYGRHTDHTGLNTTQNEVFGVLWHLKKQGYSDYTINFVRKALKVLEDGCGLQEPESVKHFIAEMSVADSYKRNLCYAYEHYLRLNELTWERPRYYARERLPRIPSEKTIDMIIAASRPRLAVKLSISKETGLRPVELLALRVKDVDLEKGIVYPRTAKHGAPRALKIKTKTLNMLKTHIHINHLNVNQRIFTQTSAQYGKSFRNIRKKVSDKLEDPSIRTIRLYDLRHFFATKLYHDTKDILYVKAQMGHRKIATTLRYTQLVDMGDDEWVVKVASSLEDFTALLESGFEYVSDYNGLKVLRKRK
jgi:integrase